MYNHFSMGAINKITNKYEYPKIANKINKYKCPSCEKDVIFRNGKINQPHFAHYKSDNPCYYYDNPNETQIHKDAKLLMKTLLDNKNNISIHRTCNYCEQRNCGYSECIDYDIFDDDYNNTKAIIEYKFNYNNSNRSADIALLENDKIKYIFEICYKHKTKEENRPEPWFEIDAEKLIHNINSGENIDEEIISIDCIRNYICRFCIEYERKRYIDFLEKSQKERIEKEILRKREEEIEIERKKREQERKEEEQERKKAEKLKKENEEKQKQLCKCGIMIVNICICKNQKYELQKLNNNLCCINCNKWKCRCK
jgi:hypothetical protein